MIVVRNTFQIHAGQMKRAVAMAKEGRAVGQLAGLPAPRLLVDVAADFYTLVLENEYSSLSEFETRLPQVFANVEWQKWYQGFTELVRCGRREIFRIVD